MAVSRNPIVDWDHQRWREQAGCRYTGAGLFLPGGSTGAASDRIEAAKTVYGSCPVANACLQFALETNQGAGIWAAGTRTRAARGAGCGEETSGRRSNG